MTNLTRLSSRTLLVVGALVGLSFTTACDPKKIGAETEGAEDSKGSSDDGDAEGTYDGGDEATDSGGAVCEEGDKKPADDGCNTCVCFDGDWGCTLLACDPEPPPACKEGEVKPAGDGCNECMCIEGDWACTMTFCEPECEPGEEKMDDCNACICTDDGVWACDKQQCPSTCGDGKVDEGEQCDDGNLIDLDGCSSTCGYEVGESCEGSDPLVIQGAAIKGDELVVDVQYGGGCEQHDLGICWDGAFAESDPVQIWIGVSHDAHGDLCDALISEQRALDLTPQKTAYQEGYQTENGTITIHLEGWAGPLQYTF
jgi:cysteine-rich repeat protein